MREVDLVGVDFMGVDLVGVDLVGMNLTEHVLFQHHTNLVIILDTWAIFEKQLALFPGSPLAPTKNKKGGREPGIDSHVIPRDLLILLIV